ncbi:MAG: GGDEF domain-containing protein [Myxococcales bacterium]|nr:MAG: GGDEF domain-containing protein [Myxococcales bacterium]
MASYALSDDKLRPFLRRKRRSNSVVTPPPMGAFLADTLGMATRLVPSHGAFLLMDDPKLRRRTDGSPLSVVAVVGNIAPDVLGSTLSQKRGIEGEVYRKGVIIARSDHQTMKKLRAQMDGIADISGKSLVAYPVRLESAICGVLVLVQRKSKKAFSERDMQLVELFSGYISRAILNAVDILKQNELALYDPLTGILNVRSLGARLEMDIKTAQATNGDVAVLFADLDRLKRLNDRMGHPYGSEAIRRTANALQDTLSDRGTVFRFGGDEFVAICPGLSMKQAEGVSRELLDAIKTQVAGPTPEGSNLPKMTISIGIATLRSCLRETRHDKDLQPSPASRLITVADRALYRAKRAGRARASRGTKRDDR